MCRKTPLYCWYIVSFTFRKVRFHITHVQENSFILLILCWEHLPLLMKMIKDYRRKPMQWWNSVSFISQQRETRWIQEVTSHRSHLLFCYKISPTQLARENQLSDHSGWLVVNWHLTITTSCSMTNVLLFPKHSKDKHYWRSIKAIREFKNVVYCQHVGVVAWTSQWNQQHGEAVFYLCQRLQAT